MSSSTSRHQLQKIVDKLTFRESDVLKNILFGYSNSEIADALAIAKSTVKIYRASVYKKLNVTSLSGVLKLFKVRPTIEIVIKSK
jgi:DNA-binding NarL/FixJ family response regulator